MKRITVFTPTYNRAGCLGRCYESMKRQTCQDFEWLIIDDGSTDNTKELVQTWMDEPHLFCLRYIYKENGGLHTGYNTAIANIDTELCVCVDSDDFMPDDAIETILDFWSENGSEEVAGIVGLDSAIDGEMLGDPLPDQRSINLIDLLMDKYKLRNADRTNVVRTELYKKYAPMTVFVGEKNFNPHYLHLQISQEYDFLVLNRNLKYVEYQADGMSAGIWRQYLNSPNSFAETRRLYLSFKGTSLQFQIRHAIHYVSSSILAKNFKFISQSPRKALTILVIPFGCVLAGLTKYMGAKKKN